MKHAIELVGLKKKLGHFTLGPMTLAVPEGCIIGYIGENGAGKSTTIKLLLGLMTADEGEIKILGKDVNHFPIDMKKDIAYVFDDLYLPQDMNLDNIRKFHQKLYGKVWQNDSFDAYVKRFVLPEGKAIKHFSRGMKMQLGLALALSHEAKILLLDEATSGLDPVVRDDVLDLLLDYMQNEEHTVLISSHILSDLEKVADYIAFIHKGRLLFMEAKDELTDQYGLATLSNEQFQALDPKAVVGSRKHQFGVEALLKRNLVPDSMELEKISVEDLMVYMIKGERA